MESTIQKYREKMIEEHVNGTSVFLFNFLEKYEKWKYLRKNALNEELKRFEHEQGTAFLQLLAFFENLLEGEE